MDEFYNQELVRKLFLELTRFEPKTLSLLANEIGIHRNTILRFMNSVDVNLKSFTLIRNYVDCMSKNKGAQI